MINQKIKFFSIIITILALGDGIIHFLLDYILFKGQLWGRLAFPASGKLKPGIGKLMRHVTPSHMPISNPILKSLDISKITGLPLNELFLLDAVGYLVLLVIFWSWPQSLKAWHWVIDLVMIVYAAAAIIGWFDIGMPNPHNLGFLSKGVESLLIIVLIIHIWLMAKKNTPTSTQQ